MRIRSTPEDPIDDKTMASTYISDAIRDLMFADSFLARGPMTEGRKQVLACIELVRKSHTTVTEEMRDLIRERVEAIEREESEC